MSIEVDCGTIRNPEGRQFAIYAHVCEEFPNELDLVTIRYGAVTIFEDKPAKAQSAFERWAVAHARVQVNQTRLNEQVIEDFWARRPNMSIVSDDKIIAASLLILDKHHGDSTRPLRLLIAADFPRICVAKQKIAQHWRREKHQPDADYARLRTQLLDHWMKKHNWNIRTRNLYSSIIAKLTVWDKYRLSQSDRQRLEQLEPGARLYLQFLHGRQKRLV